jgi:uncharacterized protein (TIGR03083 family)
MNYEEFVDALRRDGPRMHEAAVAARTGTTVPSCPDWTVADLLRHLGRLHRWVTDLVANQPDDPMRAWANPLPEDDAVLDWFAAGIEPLADALDAAGPETTAWSWTPDHTAGIWARRQANELAMHCYDAQLAANAPEPIERALAVDGIDELFDLLPFWSGSGNVKGNDETIHFHCTDGDGEWLARLSPDGVVVTREHAKGDVAARGTASNLLLFLYGRLPVDRLEVFGDAALLTRWRELVNW